MNRTQRGMRCAATVMLIGAVPEGVITMPKGGAKLRIDVVPGEPESIEVLHGRILAAAGGHATTVKAKRRFTLLPGGGVDLLAMVKADSWQKWSQKRDEMYHRALMLSRTMAPMANLTALVPQATVQPAAPGSGADLSVPPEQQLSPIVSELNREAQEHRVVTIPSCAHQ